MALITKNHFRRLAARRSSPAPCVYDWSAWNVTLLHNIAPRAKRIRACFDEDPKQLADRLPGSARTLLLHLDISDNRPFIACPTNFVRTLAEREITVLNAHVADIRKTTVQSCCQRFGLPSVTPAPTGNPDEMLIVKSDLNTGGTREQRLSPQQKSHFKLPPNLGKLQGRNGYYVARRADLTADVWNDRDLVVERFMQNPLGRFFRIYASMNAVVVSEGYIGSQIKRMGDGVRRYNHWYWRHDETLAPLSNPAPQLPTALLNTAAVFINRFQLDYGAMDVVENETGDFHIIDVNKTPFWDDEHQPGLLAHLRLGFEKAGRMI